MQNERQYPAARITREYEPYHFQRKRHHYGEHPKPPQPMNMQKQTLGWGGDTFQYWDNVLKEYMTRRNTRRQ